MIITLIGMSGAGKSHWSRKLEELGFNHINADDMIEAKLGPELTSQGYKGINDVAKWMGQPYEAQYPRTSQAYLDFERDAMLETLTTLDTLPAGANKVIDTTGSVIYLPEAILVGLASKTTMVYFHTPESAHAKMAEQYLADPKPVPWGESYRQNSGETPSQALTRCYPKLLIDRSAKYQKLAHVTFDYDELRSSKMTAQHIIDRAAEYSGATRV
jgi:shikimate kinase